MNQSHKFSKIKWACRRGMLELDFILTKFLEHGFQKLSEIEQDELLQFLTNEDPDLYSWLMGFRQATAAADIKMVNIIRETEQLLQNAQTLAD